MSENKLTDTELTEIVEKARTNLKWYTEAGRDVSSRDFAFVRAIIALHDKLAAANSEVEAWQELWDAEVTLDDLALDHPDHHAAIQRVVKAADGLMALKGGERICSRACYDAQAFAQREDDARKSEVTRLRAELAEAREAIDAEPELPGDMPDEMWDAIRNDKDAVSEAIRTAVRQTKENIRAALSAARKA